MQFDKILDDCVALENTISFLIKNNANKQTALNNLQSHILENSQSQLNQLVDREHELWSNLENLKATKEKIGYEIKQYSDINEKLSDLVAIAQRASNEKLDVNDKFNEANLITDSLLESEQLIGEYLNIKNEIVISSENLEKDELDVEDLVKNGKELAINLEKNDNLIRVLEQQNKYAEEQFDLILNQLPWQPLTESYIAELLQSNEEGIRDLAGVLQVQSGEINDLNESLCYKKQQKLEILEQLADQLNLFSRKRDEAILMEDHGQK